MFSLKILSGFMFNAFPFKSTYLSRLMSMLYDLSRSSGLVDTR